MRRETLRLLMVGQWPHSQAIRLPLIVSIEIVAPGGPDSELVVSRERRALISDRQAIGRRTARRIDLTQTEDHRLMSECLVIVDEVGVQTFLTETRWAESFPPINAIQRAVQLWRAAEPIDDQIGHTSIQRTHLKVHGDGELGSDVDEMQVEQLAMG